MEELFGEEAFHRMNNMSALIIAPVNDELRIMTRSTWHEHIDAQDEMPILSSQEWKDWISSEEEMIKLNNRQPAWNESYFSERQLSRSLPTNQ